MMIRSFISLEIPNFVIEEIISTREKIFTSTGNLKWEKKDKLHVTLKFLGDIEQEKIEPLFLKITSLGEKYNKFSLELDRFGFFKSNGIPRVLWAGLKQNIELEKFVKEIDILCSEFGFEKEKRKFNPHITMLRIKPHYEIKNLLVFDNYKLPEIKFVGEKIIMFESKLTPSGSVYNPLKSFII